MEEIYIKNAFKSLEELDKEQKNYSVEKTFKILEQVVESTKGNINSINDITLDLKNGELSVAGENLYLSEAKFGAFIKNNKIIHNGKSENKKLGEFFARKLEQILKINNKTTLIESKTLLEDKVNTPESFTIPLELLFDEPSKYDNEDLSEAINEYISDQTGFLIYNYNYEVEGDFVYVTDIEYDLSEKLNKKSLKEDKVNIYNKEKIQEYKEKIQEQDDTEVVVDLDASSKEEIKNNYKDTAILECPKCKLKIVKEPSQLIQDKESGLYNIEETCPYCNNKGFQLQGKVEEESTEEVEEIKEDINSEIEDNKNNNSENFVDNGGLKDIEEKEDSIEKIEEPISNEEDNEGEPSHSECKETKIYLFNVLKDVEDLDENSLIVILDKVLQTTNNKYIKESFQINSCSIKDNHLLIESSYKTDKENKLDINLSITKKGRKNLLQFEGLNKKFIATIRDKKLKFLK